MRTTSAVRLTISFRLCQPFFEGSKEQQQRAKGKGQRRQRGTEWAHLVFSDSLVRDNEKLSAFVELERQVLTMTFYLESFMPMINDRN
jgi:hypothetical protein